MTAHVMIDIESMDAAPTAVVLSIGLVLFNPYEPDAPIQGSYWVVDTEEQDIGGRTRSAETAQWWAEQSPEARTVLTAEGEPVDRVLKQLLSVVRSDEVEHVWANGPDFDCVILADLTRGRGPWPFWKNRCYRTIKSLALPKTYVKPARGGTHHNALDDALHQARDLQARVKALGLRF
ncbi:MAG TPA: 3'-5' exonuclease [Rhodocyclaceae bacterium]|nr:3'-5' exonuclease [Rhodocyclaceae bacterium]